MLGKYTDDKINPNVFLKGDVMDKVYKKVEHAYKSIKDKIPFEPEIGLVLGSGLGSLADEVNQVAIIDYKDIKDFPQSTAPGHKGRFVFCEINGKKVVCMQGRVHYYEGYDVTDVVLPIRLMGMMGIKNLFLTNAAGGINSSFHVGELMVITDQITFNIPSPLRGPNVSEFGVRFPDMSNIYNTRLANLIKDTASDLDIHICEGVYFQTAGPQYETPAEVRMIKAVGGDAVGMSTGIEAIAAVHMGIKVMGISCIANLAAGISPTPLTEQEVIEAGERVAPIFKDLVSEVIGRV